MKPEIEALIESLLHHHECVILPDFGGFITRDSPCNFNAAGDRLKPYSRSIFFNPHLTQNDGLLYNEIQKQEGISYQEASEAYQAWLNDTRQVILDSGSRKFGNLGTLFRGNENNVWFSPHANLNLALDTYGLYPVEVSKMITEPAVPVVELHAEQEAWHTGTTTLADNKPIEVIKPARLNYKAWLVAASVALVVHIAYLGFEGGYKSNEASVIPSLMKDSPAWQNQVEGTVNDTQNAAGQAMDTLPAVTPEQVTPTITSPENNIVETPAVITPDQQIPETEKPAVSKEGSTQSSNTPALALTPESPEGYSKVAKYRMENNAQFHLKDLQRKGVDARIISNGEWFEIWASTVPVQ